MIRLVIAGIIVYVVYRLSKSLFAPSERTAKGYPRGKESPAIKGEDLVKDPWCGTYVPISSAHTITLNGEKLYFCSKECLEKYKKEHR